MCPDMSAMPGLPARNTGIQVYPQCVILVTLQTFVQVAVHSCQERNRQAWVACGGSFIRNVHTMVGFSKYNLNTEC